MKEEAGERSPGKITLSSPDGRPSFLERPEGQALQRVRLDLDLQGEKEELSLEKVELPLEKDRGEVRKKEGLTFS